MTVLHVIASMDPRHGGVCQAVRTIIQGLQPLGIQNEVASLDDPAGPSHDGDHFPHARLGPASGPWQYGRGLKSWLQSHLERFDAVILHGLWLYHGYALRRTVQSIRVRGGKAPRFLVMPHGMLDPYFQKDPSRRLKAVRNEIYWKVIERKTVNDADGLLFTCEEEKRLARLAFQPYRPAGEHIVGLGVDFPPPFTDTMASAFAVKCAELAGRPYLLFLSRLHAKKGIDILIQTWAEMAAQGTGAGRAGFPSLVVAGPLDTAYAEEMRQLAERLCPPASASIKPSIFFPGMLQGDAKWGAFYGCLAFVLPSHQENFGIAVVEAQACGKPVLISEKVNIWREITAGGAGWAAEDSGAGVRRLISDFLALTPEKSAALPRQAMECYLENFGVEGAGRRLAAVLNPAGSESRRAPPLPFPSSFAP
ncbi:MAG: group 1 glycosyl transferase [Verrucomicrobiales bacterium]|nr:group 1 glycosyl transferase [Verrucomicrobiales bacterium]